jgi:hypothetical protein
MQIKYLNRALQRFDATQVIPTQFVLFTLSVILGSAVLYRDFEKKAGEDAGEFIGGCAMTFIGVWFITSARSSPDSDDESYIEEDDEAIILRHPEQVPTAESNVTGSQASLQSIQGFSDDEMDGQLATPRPHRVDESNSSKVSLPESLERNHWDRSGTDTGVPSEAVTPMARSRTTSNARDNASPMSAGPSPMAENPWTGNSSHPYLADRDRTLKAKTSSIQRLISAFFPDADPESLPTQASNARFSAPDISTNQSNLSTSSAVGVPSASQTPRMGPSTRNTTLLGTSLPENGGPAELVTTPSRPHSQHPHLLPPALYPGAFPSPLSSSLSAMVTNSIRRSRASVNSLRDSPQVGPIRRRSTRPRVPNMNSDGVAIPGAHATDGSSVARRGTTASDRSGNTSSYMDDDDDVSSIATTTPSLTPAATRTLPVDTGTGSSRRMRTPLRLGDRLSSLFSRARSSRNGTGSGNGGQDVADAV